MVKFSITVFMNYMGARFPKEMFVNPTLVCDEM